jgi:aminotransferase
MLGRSRRTEQMVQSAIRTMTVECEKIGGINLSQGVCDTEVPLPVRRGAIDAIEQGLNQYTRLDGIDRLRRAIARKLERDNAITADPAREIVVSAGSTGAFYSACMALLDPGDEVVIFEPCYGYHVNTVLSLGARPAYVTLQPPDWTFTPAGLERATSGKTRALILNTPANPSGKVFTRTELEWIAEWAQQHDVFVFTDEIYEYFVYDGRRHISIGSLPGMKERTITISGFSKTFSVTGWRVGYAACDARWAEPIGYLSDLVYICAPAPLQWGVAAGLDELAPEFYSELKNEYAAKRDLICNALARAGLTPCIPQGAYYVLADASRLPGTTSKERAMFLLRETGVASVPGESFFQGETGETFLRFCFAKTDSDLQEACRRLACLQVGKPK